MNKPGITIFLLLAAPILAAHLYSASANYLVLICSLASAALFVFAIRGWLDRLDNLPVRTVSGVIAFSLLAAYVYAQLLSFYFQGVHLNQQFFYHFDLTTLRITLLIYYPLAILFVLWLGAIWGVVWVTRRRRTSRLPRLSLLVGALLLAMLLDPSIRRTTAITIGALANARPVDLELIEWDRLGLNRDAISQPAIEAVAGKHLVFVFLEGVEAVYTDTNVFPGLTPNLNALASQGWHLAGLEQVPGSGWTIGGIVSAFCGTPLIYESRFHGNNIMQNNFLDEVQCLPDILREAGYHQVFMGGADKAFGGKGDFLSRHSYDEVLGRDELSPLLADPDYLGTWGLYDDSLFDQAVRRYARLAARGEPFNLTLLTVDTHHPYGEPSARCEPYSEQDNSTLHAVHCTDQLVGDFIDRLRGHPAWEDTVVVIVSDHLAMPNAATDLFPRGYARHLYFTLLNGAQSGASQAQASPMDIAPSVLAQMGVQHNARFLAGSSVAGQTASEPKPYLQNTVRYLTLRQLNSRYLSSNDRGDLLYSLDTVAGTDFGQSHQIADLTLDEGILSFTATGDDPYLQLPPLEQHDSDWLKVFISLESADETELALYFQSEGAQGYSEDRKYSTRLQEGHNEVVFFVEDRAVTGALRLDPGDLEGDYLITSLEIRSRLN